MADRQDLELAIEDLKAMLDKVLQANPQMSRLIGKLEDPYGVPLPKLAALLLGLQAVKDAGYGSSWAKRGEFGVFENYFRKTDRLETLALLVMAAESGELPRQIGVGLVAQIADGVNYGLMWLSWLARMRPEAFRNWLEDDYCADTGLHYVDVNMFLMEGQQATAGEIIASLAEHQPDGIDWQAQKAKHQRPLAPEEPLCQPEDEVVLDNGRVVSRQAHEFETRPASHEEDGNG